MKKTIIYTSVLIVLFTAIVVSAWYLFLKPGDNCINENVTTENNATENVSGENKENKKTSGALQSLHFLNEARSYPEKDIPNDKYFAAFEYTKNSLREISFGNDNPVNQWESIGPNNIGGRTLSIALHPTDTSVLYMGAASGGLWKSLTGGIGANAWQYIETGYPSLAVSSIVIDSLNPNVMYIGTGENYGYQYSYNGLDIRVTRGMYGIGILKTTNGGTSWTKSLDWTYSSQRGVWKVLFNPKNRNVLYAATSEGVWKTNDAGTSWQQVLNYQMVVDIEINPVDTNVLYISIGNLNNNVPNANLGIYKTTNSGANWVELTNGLPGTWSGKTSIDIYKRNPNRLVASIANDFSSQGIYVTTDAGGTWSLQPGTATNYLGSQGWFTNPLCIKNDDSSNVIVGGVDLYRSTTAGSNLIRVSNWSLWIIGQIVPPGGVEGSSNVYAHADHHEIASNYRDAAKLYICTDGGLFRSNDFGSTYYGCNGGYQTTQFYNGFSNSYLDSALALGGLQDNATARYEGTNSWRKVYGGDGFWCAFNSQNNTTAYISYTYAAIQRSNDGAINNFTQISPPGGGSGNNYCFSAPYIVCKSNPQVMYVGGLNLYKSTAAGSSWQSLGSLGGYKALSMDGSSTGTDTVYIGTAPQISGGATAKIFLLAGNVLTDITNGQIPNRYVTDIHVNPNNSRVAYATLGGFGSGHVFRTTNAGLSWTDITANLPDVPHQAVCIDPLYPQNIYVGNDLGVYISTNNGGTWFEFRQGMPYALVMDLKVVPTARKIRVATHGNGVYQRELLENPIGITQTGNTVPREFSLSQNYPNPFNPATKIRFDIARAGNVKLTVYDISGRLVTTLVNKTLAPASYTADFNGAGLASGVYFYRLETSDAVFTRKMTIVK
jgi:photosystem II stability/assembly factor-like uncharacterized protein